MWTRLTAELDERRDLVAAVVALLAVVLVLHGWRTGSHAGIEVAAGMLLVARAIALGRPLTRAHVLLGLALVVVADAAHRADHDAASWATALAAGVAVGLPRRPPRPATADDRRHVWALVDRTAGDTLAPFALRTDKSYVFTPDRSAAVAYRVRLGTAIASGDPVGNPEQRATAIDAFLKLADESGWRAGALGASESCVGLWRERGLRAVPIGRDVVLDVASFDLTGRRFRNVRQAVRRTHNAGVSTEIVPERGLDPQVRAELVDVMRAAGKSEQSRGFAMILDHVLEGVHPGTFVALARDHDGTVVAFQRYATADGGRELSLDVPWRRPGAPNGVDERLIADVVAWGGERHARSVSLAFAAFPELFSVTDRGPILQLAYRAVRLLDRFIKLESLYRFVRKFHAFGPQRYVALRPIQVVAVALTALTLEFGSVAKGERG
jgi:lysylphosphatidylglycerol synthetase-like protein (DUF2156 family)